MCAISDRWVVALNVNKIGQTQQRAALRTMAMLEESQIAKVVNELERCGT
jgi:hypothetical protein